MSTFLKQPIEMPALNVKLVPVEKIFPNDYNPNHISSIELSLLEWSIINDGYTQPIVCYRDDEANSFIIVDGFHRYLVGKERLKLQQLPVVVIDKPHHQRMASTIRHNRARGVHGIQGMTELVSRLAIQGYGDEWISINLGMSKEEILRLKQSSGLKQAFANHQFSETWREFEGKYYK